MMETSSYKLNSTLTINQLSKYPVIYYTVIHQIILIQDDTTIYNLGLIE